MTTKNNIPEGYKDSAVGIIPQEWCVFDFGDIAYVSKEKYTPTKSSHIACVELEHISQGDGVLLGYTEAGLQKSTKNIFKKGNILFGKLRPYLRKYWLATFDGVCSSEIWVLLANERVCTNEYLSRIIATNKFIQCTNVSIGSKMPRADWNFVSLTPFPIPPMAEQKKIAEILGVWDEAIEKQNLLIEKLELRKRGLMQRLLTGKTRLPGFTEPWQKVKLGEISTIKKGVQVNKNTLQEYGKYPTINGGIEPSGYSDNYNTEANTITISEGGNSCGYVNFITTKFWSGGHCYTITPLNNIKNLYLYHQLKYFEPRIMIQRVGSGLPNIQFNMLIKFECFLPTLLEQTAIAEVLNTADKEIAIHSKTLDALRLQKRGLMQQLLTGKTRVKI